MDPKWKRFQDQLLKKIDNAPPGPRFLFTARKEEFKKHFEAEAARVRADIEVSILWLARRN